MNAQGFVLQPTYQQRRGVPVVRLLGRLATGQPFVVEDDRFRPYFFVPREHSSLVPAHRDVACEASSLVDFENRAVVRVQVSEPSRVPELREALRARGVRALEADVRFAYRYLIDRGLRSAIAIEGEPRLLPGGALLFSNPALAPCELRPHLRVVSLDIETTPDASRILSFALATKGHGEVSLVSASPVPGATHLPDERALLEALAVRVRALDPDVITGWSIVDFDLRVLLERAGAEDVSLALGTVPGPLRIQRDTSFTRTARAELPGRQVLDAQGLVRDAFIPLADYRLETAAQSLLGRGKRIDEQGLDRAREIQRLYREDPAELAAYNLEDARLVLEIVEQEQLIELTVERSLLTGMQLDRVGASIASFDLLYLPELRRRGRVAPSVEPERKQARIIGGAVLDSAPGFYRNVAVFDFRSLYPSLMRTFNLDPLAFAEAAGDPGALVAPNGARFSRQRGLLPEILERFAKTRARAKERGDRHADLAVKIMMNAMSGVLGSGACRFFSPEVANAITSFGQQTLFWTREAFEKLGMRALYGDTDSIFIALEEDASSETAQAQAEDLRERVQEAVARRVRDDYGVEPALELELECVYERFFQPSLRGGAEGSKKRYAGWLRGEVVVVGLEAVRRDWPQAAKRLQLGLLERAFRGAPVAPFVLQMVSDLRAGALDRELVFRKAIRKGALDRYQARAAPHVVAARKAKGALGREIRYVITQGGAEPVLPGRPFPAPLDRGYYEEKVLRPIADAILRHLGTSLDRALGRPEQLSLL